MKNSSKLRNPELRKKLDQNVNKHFNTFFRSFKSRVVNMFNNLLKRN